MKLRLLFVILLQVSQHALAVLVEVNEGAESVLLPCLYSGFIPENDPTVMWTRNDLDPKSVHLLREGGDDLRGQNQRYSGRTSVRSDALDSGDFSLTLRKPQLTDSGSYTCSISDGRRERRLRDIQLQVKDQQVEVKVKEGSESVILPCKTTPDLPEDTRVEWTRSDPEFMMVHEYDYSRDQLKNQDGFYRNRTKMNEDLLRTGDLSLTLKQPTQRDTGGYICTIYRDKDILRQKVVLQVRESFPSWVKALLVLLVLLVVSGGFLFYFWHFFMSVYKVEVDSGVESVQLPCKTIVHLLKEAKVEWKDNNNRKVHVYQKGSDRPEEQDQDYRGRTKMNEDLLKPGDLSLTLKHPTDGDTNTYTCTIYNTRAIILMTKEVLLTVRVHLPEDVKVEWKSRYCRKVHLYQNGSDQLEEQYPFYRDRTKMNEDLLKTGDLSLTLKYPTNEDTNIYTCTVCSMEGNTLMRKEMRLKVKGQCCRYRSKVEVEEGVESIQLSFKTSENLPEDAKVEWVRYNPKKIVHVSKDGSDQPDKQHQDYRDRTKMNEDPLKTGDLSLTLNQPTERDSGEYRCGVYGKIWRGKTVLLTVKGRAQVQDQTGIIRNRSSSIDPTPLSAEGRMNFFDCSKWMQRNKE
ncbi:uncharacterized protein LOC115777962 [Archocentrus centrarchus]|uniref:uncharacterized protein LOC115777962 n=1 Tax=Archocentrus centrarchus TaxID=63155 RepID=UPI0011EA1801|nr:uncharacterized protein LOC115777962 [Archocentrus centrarchus]